MTVVLALIAATANCLAAYCNIRQSRRLRRQFEAHHVMFARLLAFAALLSQKESGAPDHIRAIARNMLPPGTHIDVSSGPETFH